NAYMLEATAEMEIEEFPLPSDQPDEIINSPPPVPTPEPTKTPTPKPTEEPSPEPTPSPPPTPAPTPTIGPTPNPTPTGEGRVGRRRGPGRPA
ncbi:MAG TPA: hypothetical protein VE889_09090, partial [Actinomycetota bacterium]|nr:hypothetical protein [Actinomycetota bacterium]